MISGDVIRVGIQWNLIVQCRVDFIVLIVLHEKLQVDCIFLHFTCLTTWAIWRVLTELICRNILLLIGTISYAKRTNWARSESMWEEESKIDKHKVIAWLIKISYLRYLNAMRPPTAAEKNETTVKRVMLGINTYKLARRRIIRRKLYMHFIDFLSSFQLTNKQQNEVIRRLWRQSNKYSIIHTFFCGIEHLNSPTGLYCATTFSSPLALHEQRSQDVIPSVSRSGRFSDRQYFIWLFQFTRWWVTTSEKWWTRWRRQEPGLKVLCPQVEIRVNENVLLLRQLFGFIVIGKSFERRSSRRYYPLVTFKHTTCI